MAFIIVTFLLLVVVFGVVRLLTLPAEDDDFRFEDIDFCSHCERYSKENCRDCVYNKFRR